MHNPGPIQRCCVLLAFLLLAAMLAHATQVSDDCTARQQSKSRRQLDDAGAKRRHQYLGISSNTCATADNELDGNVWTANSFGANQFSQATLLLVPFEYSSQDSSAAVLVRGGTSDDSGYYGGFDTYGIGSNYAIWYRPIGSGADVVLVRTSQAPALNDVVKVQAVGTTITLTVNGITIATATDAHISSGSPGLQAATSVGPVSVFGSWSRGRCCSRRVLYFGHDHPGGERRGRDRNPEQVRPPAQPPPPTLPATTVSPGWPTVPTP